MPVAALWTFWAGLLGLCVLRGAIDPSWDYDVLLPLWYGMDAITAALLAVVGILSRRQGLAVGAVVTWVVATVLLLATNEGWNWVLDAFDLEYTTLNHLARAVLAVICTLFAAAYLAVRRSAPAAYAFLPLVLVLAAAWFELSVLLLESSPGGLAVYRVWNASYLPIGLAITAGVVALAGRLTRGASAVPAPPVPQQAWAVAGPQQAPYGWGAPYPVAKTNTLAIVALVLGIVGISLGAVICGHISLGQIGRTGEQGRGMAIAGLVLGYIGLAITVLLILLLVGVAASTSSF
jgi:hypothetical protein